VEDLASRIGLSVKEYDDVKEKCYQAYGNRDIVFGSRDTENIVSEQEIFVFQPTDARRGEVVIIFPCESTAEKFEDGIWDEQYCTHSIHSDCVNTVTKESEVNRLLSVGKQVGFKNLRLKHFKSVITVLQRILKLFETHINS
jgi:hypothetical protein